ncbi:MAG TPA: hypothetical protein VHD85_06500 [Terracidiphilus sp.]|nr:hypothetical protein [Terracidiphilus sp.]
MTHKAKPRSHSLLIALFVVLAVVILLLRLLVFVAGHGRRHL